MKFIRLLSIIVFATAPKFISHAQTATFKFAPRLDTVCIKTENRNTTTKYAVGAETKTISVEHELSVDKFRYRKTEHQYFISDQTTKISGEINGKPFENPLNPVLLAVIPTNVVSEDGQLLHVLGNEQMAIQAEKIFPPEARPQIEAQMNTNVLEQIAKSRWNDSIGVLVGQTIKQGDTWKNRVSSGDSRLHFEYVFPSIVETNSNVLVTVLIFGSTDSKFLDLHKLEDAKNLDSREVKNFLNSIAADSTLLKICVQQIVDANTMDVIAEHEIQQTISPVSNGVKIEEERDRRSYQYVH